MGILALLLSFAWCFRQRWEGGGKWERTKKLLILNRKYWFHRVINTVTILHFTDSINLYALDSNKRLPSGYPRIAQVFRYTFGDHHKRLPPLADYLC